MSKLAIFEKSNGFSGNPAPGVDVALLCPDWFSVELDSEVLTVELVFSSNKHKHKHINKGQILQADYEYSKN